MKLITIAGPPSSGKTSVAIKSIGILKKEGYKVGVVKFDCLATTDQTLYEKLDIPVQIGLSGGQCPDHFYISNILECTQWGKGQGLDYLFIESAGLCNRCSPHIKNVLSLCVIDNLSGVNTPNKIGPMLIYTDVVIITKGDIVSQAEREVFRYRVHQVNQKAKVLSVNGLTGQGAFELIRKIKEAKEIESLERGRLRFTMPTALCSYCLGETLIGEDYQTGNVKKMKFTS